MRKEGKEKGYRGDGGGESYRMEPGTIREGLANSKRVKDCVERNPQANLKKGEPLGNQERTYQQEGGK